MFSGFFFYDFGGFFMERALNIAKYIISYCSKQGRPVSNLQVQKILFFLQVKYYKAFGEWLFSDEIEAWPYGPVVRGVYDVFFGYGGSKIDNIYECNINEEIKNFINPIINELSRKNPWQLVEQTHKKGGSWDTTFRQKGKYAIINKDLIAKDINIL